MRQRTYTLSELEEQSHFDKRTIAYYVQESLLPRVGRRGRKTRYSAEFLDRLMFIRRVRDLQDAGKLRAVTLSEIRDVIDGLSAREIRSASRKGVSAETLRSLFAEPDLDSSELAVSAEEMALSTMAGSAIETSRLEETVGLDAPSPARASARREALVSASRAPGEVAGGSGRLRGRRWPSSGEGEEERRVGQLLAEIDRSAGRGAKPSEGRTRERVTRVPVTEDIFVSVRNMSEEHAELVEELAERLRRLGRLD